MGLLGIVRWTNRLNGALLIWSTKSVLNKEVCEQCEHVSMMGYWNYTALSWNCCKTSAVLVDEEDEPPKECPYELEHRISGC